MAFNVVELMASAEGSDDCAFDQPCKFGHRVEGHAVYCHNDAWESGPRKCRRTWYTGGETKDEDCPGFQPNSEFKGALTPTPIVGPLCTKCKGSRLFSTDLNRVETCLHCEGDGCEPQAMSLSQFGQDTLEISMIDDGKNSRQSVMRLCETKAQIDELWKMQEDGLVRIRTISQAKSITGVLLEITGKGAAVMRANWDARKQP